MRSPAANVGILDDEPRFRQALSRLLRTYGFRVRPFERAHDLFTALSEESIDCLLLDLHMPGMSGFDVLRQLRTRSAPPPVIVITGHDEPGNLERVCALSAADYLLKPVDEAVLLKSIERCLVPGPDSDSAEAGGSVGPDLNGNNNENLNKPQRGNS